MVEYFTEAYWDELAADLNADEDFRSAAGDLTTQLLFVAEDKGRACLMEVEDGEVQATPADADTEAEFAFTGPYETWIDHHKGEADLQRLVMTGKINFDGSMGKIMSLQKQLGFVTDRAREIDAEY